MECIGQTTESCKGCISAKQNCTYKAVPRSSTKASALGAQSRRKILLEKVVLPLRKALHLVNWEDSLDIPEAIPLKSSRRNKSGLLSQLRYSRNGDPDHPEDVSLVAEFYKVSLLSSVISLDYLCNRGSIAIPRSFTMMNGYPIAS